ncbi:MAG: isoprenylcysteine carboxylmethyltransferase family protein [Candidatus Heimdallarchaeota archaeon]|nr:isoprenylcysteine carboxylmethyltransferase family protein [Candidatus Heimdallarchaeota archaeon]MCK4253435.1 isoprenylcysteine carboxylmethyltransferase family protein [Candidatus Heimdallarchaeota archaeon]
MNENKEKIQGFTRRKHKGRKDLAGEHKLTDIGQVILLFIFLVVWCLDSFLFKFSTFLADDIPIYVTIPLGAIVLIISGFFAFTGLRKVFKEVREKPGVVTSGVFAYCRHPVYLGSILLFVGLSILAWSLSTLGLCVIIIIFYEYVATYEEKLLVEQFGQEYKDYQKKVPKWIPGLKFFQTNERKN